MVSYLDESSGRSLVQYPTLQHTQHAISAQQRRILARHHRQARDAIQNTTAVLVPAREMSRDLGACSVPSEDMQVESSAPRNGVQRPAGRRHVKGHQRRWRERQAYDDWIGEKAHYAPDLLRERCNQQTRHANFIQRPRRPYTFMQLIQLSDGSTYTVRTTSPNPIYRPAKDSRNTRLWQPTDEALNNVEEDDTGSLALFRTRYGRGFDAAPKKSGKRDGRDGRMDAENFTELLQSYAPASEAPKPKARAKPPPSKKK
ncbi:hypothetical protein CDD80_2398 [Ophiocordyceps camponoti-rufipedis]|uniref:Ribosomal protein bL31m N-terminal domain-containing protein n=1 Tax=Ophiocordyceps camponoti-rufipedis TaxID=2004952 RepID=A0A2C5Z892_9HYPO|nr:hypothetical protein CDD80_2398 [Ophiocordyceps camponoti-rufipedis]